MLRSTRLLAPLLAVVVTLPAAAAETAAEDVAAARTLGVQGITLADDGHCAEAIEKLERAEALYHAPTILGRLGECQVEIGHIVLGTENLNRVVREQLAPNAPSAFKAAQERAKKVLDKALPRIAYLTVHVEPSTANASVTVDTSPVPAALIGAERPTDPGTHEVSAIAAGFIDAKSSVTLAEGAHQEVTLTLTRDATAPVAAVAPAAAPAPVAPTQPPPAAAPRDNSLAIFALGVGGAGLLAGSITGIMAISKKGSLDCPNKQCPPSQHDKLDSANTLAMVSNVGFGVGIVGVAVGTVLLLTGKKAEAAPTASVGTLRARPYVSQSSLGLEGAF